MLRLAALCLLLAGCAAPFGAAATGARLQMGASIAPPAGLLDYCVRTPDECASAPIGELRGREAPTGAARFERASERGAQSAFFQTLLAQRRTAAPAPAPPRIEANVDAERFAELHRVNRRINRAIRPVQDSVFYGVDEFWTRPLAGASRGRASGDCEDYALEKRAALLALGWPPEALMLATAVSPRVGLHAVLIVSTDRGDYVLDNLYDRPQPVAALDYVWISRQSGASLTEWSSVVGVGGAAVVSGGANPSDGFHRLLLERAARRGRDVGGENPAAGREAQTALVEAQARDVDPQSNPARRGDKQEPGAALVASQRAGRPSQAPMKKA